MNSIKDSTNTFIQSAMLLFYYVAGSQITLSFIKILAIALNTIQVCDLQLSFETLLSCDEIQSSLSVKNFKRNAFSVRSTAHMMHDTIISQNIQFYVALRNHDPLIEVITFWTLLRFRFNKSKLNPLINSLIFFNPYISPLN